VALDGHAARQFGQRRGRGNLFHLRPVFAFVRVARVQERFVPLRLVAQQQQPLGICVQPADGIDIFRKAKLRERAVGRTVAGELRQHAVGFVKRDQHGRHFQFSNSNLQFLNWRRALAKWKSSCLLLGSRLYLLRDPQHHLRLVGNFGG
jgi:hypothetical protein